MGDWRFEPEQNALIDASDQKTILRPQTGAVLRLLAENAGRIVTRDHILSEVWPDVIVTDDSVTQCIREIRARFGTDGHRIIRTFPKRGYMLDLPVVAAKPPNPSLLPDVNRRWLFVGTAMAFAILVACLLAYRQVSTSDGAVPSITVFPFMDSLGTEHGSRIGKALSTEIASALARHNWLDVHLLPRDTSSDTEYVLSGTIAVDIGSLRLTAQLLDTDSGRVLWSYARTGHEDDLFRMQGELLQKVEASATPAWSGVVSRDRTARIQGTTDRMDAYDHYLVGIDQKHRFTPEALAAAQRNFERALSIDPEFGRAWVALAIVHLLQMEQARSRDAFEAHLAARLHATEAAMRLIPDDAESLIQSTFIYGRAHDYKAAVRALQRAAEMGRNNPDILAQAAWGGSRRVDLGSDAVSWAKRAIELNPNPPPWYFAGLATAAFYAGNFELAATAYSQAPPTTEVLYRWAASEARLGRLDSARVHLSAAMARLPEGLTIMDLEAADGSTYPPFVELLSASLDLVVTGDGDITR